MRSFEINYAALIEEVLLGGQDRVGRNGLTRSKFAKTLVINSTGLTIPILQGRKMFYKGVIGEFAAFVRGPKSLADFEAFGCNYWGKWAKPDGSITLDYGNAWLQHGQIKHVVDCLNNNPADRRMLITGWIPERLPDLDLPCCHYAYQFYVRRMGDKSYLDILWHQRSTDLMVGLPSDIILAYLWLVVLCKATAEAKYVPGTITMTLGDTHIYEQHFAAAEEYVNRVAVNRIDEAPRFSYDAEQGTRVEDFNPALCSVVNYKHLSRMALEVIT